MSEVNTLKRQISSELARERRNSINRHEKELENLKNSYEIQEQKLKANSQSSLQELRTQNNAEKLEEMKRHQTALEQAKDDFNSVKKSLAQEKDQLKDIENYKLDLAKQNFQTKLYNFHERNEDQLYDLNLKAEATTQELSDKVQNETYNQELATNLQLSTIKSGSTDKLDKTKREFERYHENIMQENRKALALSEIENKKKVDEQTRSYQHRILSDKQRYELELAKQTKFYEQKLTQMHENMQRKVEWLTKNEKTVVDRLKQEHIDNIKQINAANTAVKKTLMDKADDRFYHIKTLEHDVTEFPNRYEVSIPVPPHEKENVILSVRDRLMRLSLTRDFVAETVDDMGNKNSSRRSEVFKKDINVAKIVDPSTVKQSYTDGILKFSVEKA